MAVQGLALWGLAVQEQGKSQFSCEGSEIGAVVEEGGGEAGGVEKRCRDQASQRGQPCEQMA